MADITSVKLPDASVYNIKDNTSGYASKVSSATNGHLAGLDASGELTDSGVATADVVTKVSGGTTGDLPKLDANGKIADSGILYSDVVTKVTGGTTDDLVKLDANGKIADAGKKVSDLANKSDMASIITTGATNSTGSTITAGTYFYLNGALVKAKVDIASGASYTSGTNYEAVTIGGQLTALNSKLSNITPIGYFDVTETVISGLTFHVPAYTNSNKMYAFCDLIVTNYSSVTSLIHIRCVISTQHYIIMRSDNYGTWQSASNVSAVFHAYS